MSVIAKAKGMRYLSDIGHPIQPRAHGSAATPMSYLINGHHSSAKYSRECYSSFYQENEASGEQAIAILESGAIVLRIAERAGKLIPAAPAARMRALQWLAASLNSVEPFVMALAVNDIFEADRNWSKARHTKVVDDLMGRLSDLEAALGDREWLDRDEFTVGDLMMISVLGGLRGTDVLDGLPRLAGYVARGEGRPAHRKAMADHLATFHA